MHIVGQKGHDDRKASDGDQLGEATCLDFAFYEEAGLACSDACTFDISACTEYCGDGIISGGEDCDDNAHAADFGRGATIIWPKDLSGSVRCVRP